MTEHSKKTFIFPLSSGKKSLLPIRKPKQTKPSQAQTKQPSRTEPNQTEPNQNKERKQRKGKKDEVNQKRDIRAKGAFSL